jgi:spore germination protein GerM
MKTSLLIIIAATLLFVGCGIPEDSSPESIQTTFPENMNPQPDTPEGEESRTFLIYLLDAESRLTPVQRDLPVTELQITDLINELIANPTEAETNMSLSTAVPVSLSLAGVILEEEIATINFQPGGLEIVEGDQLTEALAQIVWTVTETGDVKFIIISIDREFKTWPTPDGGDQNILTRNQFISYAPETPDAIPLG